MIDDKADKAHNKPRTFAGFAAFFPSSCSDKELSPLRMKALMRGRKPYKRPWERDTRHDRMTQRSEERSCDVQKLWRAFDHGQQHQDTGQVGTRFWESIFRAVKKSLWPEKWRMKKKWRYHGITHVFFSSKRSKFAGCTCMIYDVLYHILYIYQTPSVSFFVFQHLSLLLLCSFWCQVISSGHGEWKLIDICSAEVGPDREETKTWRVPPLKTNMQHNWVVVSNIVYFHPYLGKIPILTNIFQVGWNHQPVKVWKMIFLC